MSALTVEVTLTVEQLEVIAERVATILAERSEQVGYAEATCSFVSIAEAARLLGVTAKTVQNMVSDGRLSRHGGPRRPLASRSEVTALAAGEGREKPAQAVTRASRVRREPSRTFTSRAKGGSVGRDL